MNSDIVITFVGMLLSTNKKSPLFLDDQTLELLLVENAPDSSNTKMDVFGPIQFKALSRNVDLTSTFWVLIVGDREYRATMEIHLDLNEYAEIPLDVRKEWFRVVHELALAQEYLYTQHFILWDARNPRQESVPRYVLFQKLYRNTVTHSLYKSQTEWKTKVQFTSHNELTPSRIFPGHVWDHLAVKGMILKNYDGFTAPESIRKWTFPHNLFAKVSPKFFRAYESIRVVEDVKLKRIYLPLVASRIFDAQNGFYRKRCDVILVISFNSDWNCSNPEECVVVSDDIVFLNKDNFVIDAETRISTPHETSFFRLIRDSNSGRANLEFEHYVSIADLTLRISICEPPFLCKKDSLTLRALTRFIRCGHMKEENRLPAELQDLARHLICDHGICGPNEIAKKPSNDTTWNFTLFMILSITYVLIAIFVDQLS